MTMPSQEIIDRFCRDCERRTGPDRTCEDGLFKQMQRVQRGDCLRALREGQPGMVTKEDGFASFLIH